MCDPFLEREKELMKRNDSLNTKMTFDWKQRTKATAHGKKKKVAAAVVAAAAKSFKCDQTNQADLGTMGTSKSKTDNCEITKKPIPNASANVRKFNGVEKHELGAKDIGCNRKSSADDTHTKCNEDIKWTTVGDRAGGDDDDDADFGNKQRTNNEQPFDHALIETIQKAIDTKADASTAAHLSLIPANVHRKNVSADGIIKYALQLLFLCWLWKLWPNSFL